MSYKLVGEFLVDKINAKVINKADPRKQAHSELSRIVQLTGNESFIYAIDSKSPIS